MKRKHKMNIGLAFLVIALMVVSSTTIALGNIIESDVENNDSVIQSTNTATINCGEIRIHGKPGMYPAVDYYCDAKDQSGVSVGGGCYVTIEVDYHLWAGGDDDRAKCKITCGGKSDSFTTPDNNNEQDGTLSISVFMKPDMEYKVSLYAEWRDWVTTTNILVGGRTASDTATVKTAEAKPHLACSTTSLYVYGNPAQDGGTLRNSPGFHIDNDGDPGTTLRVQATARRTSGEEGSYWSMDPSSLSVPEDVKRLVELEVTGLPRCQKYLFKDDEEKKIYGEITLTNLDDPNNILTIPVTVHVKYKTPRSKSIETVPLLLSKLLQTQLPAFFTLLQSLPAFQR